MFFRMVYKSGQIFPPFCHNPRVWQTDRQTDRRTDGRTDRILLAIPRLHYMQRGKNRFASVSLCICLSVRLRALSRSHFLNDFHQNWWTPKRKNEFVRGQHRTTPSPILSPKTPILGQEVLKTHANIK